VFGSVVLDFLAVQHGTKLCAELALGGYLRVRRGYGFVVENSDVVLFFLLIEDLFEGFRNRRLAGTVLGLETIFKAAGTKIFGALGFLWFAVLFFCPFLVVVVVGFFDLADDSRVPSDDRLVFIILDPVGTAFNVCHVVTGQAISRSDAWIEAHAPFSLGNGNVIDDIVSMALNVTLPTTRGEALCWIPREVMYGDWTR